jgi:hypothetical protein
MTETTILYQMNPAEDEILSSDEIAEGMRVMAESEEWRANLRTEDERLRANRFCRVTKLCRAGQADLPSISFVGEWVDGYQKLMVFNAFHKWIVKKPEITPTYADLIWPWNITITYADGKVVNKGEYADGVDPMDYARYMSERSNVVRVQVTTVFINGEQVSPVGKLPESEDER